MTSDPDDRAGGFQGASEAGAFSPATGRPHRRALALAGSLLVACLSEDERAAETAPPSESSRLAMSFDRDLRPVVQIAGREVEAWTLEERMAHYRTPGVVVALFAEGRVLFERGYGTLEAGGSEAVQPDTLFLAGPLSMSLAAVTAVRFAELGELDLDAPLASWLRSFRLPPSEFETPVTLRHLLQHSSGYGPARLTRIVGDDERPSLVAVLEGRAGSEPLSPIYRPGLRYLHSEAGYALAELALAEAGGESYAALADEVVLEPLGMEASRLSAGPPAVTFARPHDARGRTLDSWGRAPSLAAAGLWLRAGDFAQLLMALERALSPAGSSFLSAAGAEAILRRGPGGFGLGFEVLSRDGPHRFAAAGSAPGGYALAWALRNRSAGAVILVNGARGEMLSREILQAIAREQGWPGLSPMVSPAATFSTLLPMVGSYRFDAGDRAGATFRVSLEGDALVLEAGPGVFAGEDEVEGVLYPSGGAFRFVDRPQVVRFQWEGEELAASAELDGDRALRADGP